MSNLIEHILNEDYVSANELFEQNMFNIQERKLYESKRMMQAEVFGGKTRAEAEKEIRARGLTPRKASDVLPDPRDIKISMRKKDDKKKRVSEETLDELTAGDVAKGVGYAAGRTIRAGGDVAHRLKRTYRLVRMKRHQAQSQKPTGDQDLRKTFGVEKPEDKKRPGIIRRNVNTLMGRQAGYVKPEKSPEEKEMERGGKIGKGVRAVGKGVGKAWGVWGNVLRAGQSGNLEE